MKPAECAAILLTLQNTDKFILQRRDKDAPTSPGLCAFFGGFVEEGEKPEEAARRELAEETSLNPESMHFHKLIDITVPAEHTAAKKVPYRYHVYSVVVSDSSFDVYEGEGMEIVSWKDFQDNKLISPSILYILSAIKATGYVISNR